MRRHYPQHLIRLAAILLLMANVVPEALAALPLCGSDFGHARTAAPTASTALKHSHDARIVHECVATKPDKQADAQLEHFAPPVAVAALPVPLHPASMLAARGPSPRGSPAHRNTYLSQRASVLLLT